MNLKGRIDELFKCDVVEDVVSAYSEGDMKVCEQYYTNRSETEEDLNQLREARRLKQLERGHTEFFEEGDVVRFSKGFWFTRERDYKIEAVHSNGFVVSSGEFEYEHTDESAIRLGMTKRKKESG